MSEAQTALHTLTTCSQPGSSRPEYLPLHPTAGRSRHRALGPEKPNRSPGPGSLPPRWPLALAPRQTSISPADSSCDTMASAHSPEQGQSWPFYT